MNGDRHQWNVGDLINIIQIVIILIGIGVVYEKFDANAVVTGVHTQQLNRIEHYLSSKDSAYYRDSKRDE